jgi:hypothetical protein
VPKNITLRKIEVWHNRWIFKNEFFNNFPTYRYFLGSKDICVFFAYLQFWHFSGILNVSQVDVRFKTWQDITSDPSLLSIDKPYSIIPRSSITI